MLEIQKSDTETGVYRARARGLLGRADYRRVVPVIESSLDGTEETPGPRLLLELDRFRGWTPGGLLEEVRFDLNYRRRLDRVAVFGGGTLARLAVVLSRPLLGGDVRFFAEKQQAERWIAEGRQTETGALSAPDAERGDLVDEASEESFPASDPPGFTPSRL